MTREEKQKAIDALKKSVPVMAMTQEEFNDYIQTLNKIMDWLEQEPILDKIRAEIETKYGHCKLTEYIVQYDGICTSVNDIGDIAEILQIIDKYKAEIKPQESEEAKTK